jgi:DNA-binding response OmpR family regulator
MNILVIDDDPAVGSAIRRALCADAVSVETDSVSGVARFASAELDGEPFELVLCDAVMHGMTGADVAAAVHAHREPPMMVLMAQPDDIVDPAGADVVLAKPFRVAELREAIEQIRAARAHAKTRACPRLLQLGVMG